MTTRYQNKYKTWCHHAVGVSRDLCDRLASSLSGNYASYVAPINSIISETEAARRDYPDNIVAQINALESPNINRGRIFKQGARFYSIPRSDFYANRAPPANLPATGNRGYHRILPSNQAISASDSRTGQWLYDRMCLEAYKHVYAPRSGHPGRFVKIWTRPRDYFRHLRAARTPFSMMNLEEGVLPLDGLTQGTINAIKNRAHNFNMYYHPSQHSPHFGLKANAERVDNTRAFVNGGYFQSTTATTAQLDQMITDQNTPRLRSWHNKNTPSGIKSCSPIRCQSRGSARNSRQQMASLAAS